MRKYLFNYEELEKDLIVLLSLFSSGHNAILLKASEESLILGPLSAVEKIIQEKLITVAIRIRLIDDMFKDYGKSYELPYFIVGDMFINIDDKKELYFREACNKIIHAKKFNVELKENNDYIPNIYLYGERRSNDWNVIIDIKKFIISCLSLLKNYDDDWDVSAL